MCASLFEGDDGPVQPQAVPGHEHAGLPSKEEPWTPIETGPPERLPEKPPPEKEKDDPPGTDSSF